MKIFKKPWAFMGILCLCLNDLKAQETVYANIYDEVDIISKMELAISHTKPGLTDRVSSWDSLAYERAKTMVAETSVYQNTHIMGWGTSNPNPLPGEYNWNSLDKRMELTLSTGGIPVLTLCAAPDWMKVPDFPFDNPDDYICPDSNRTYPSYTNWKLIERDPLPEFYDDYAHLAATVARRYPFVEYFQVWNELKGFWSESLNNWDYVAYTNLYNIIYDSLKAVNPNIKIGGPYIVIQGTGSDAFGYSGRDTYVPIGGRDRTVLEYWLENKRGADFLCVDRGNVDTHDPNKDKYTWEERISLLPLFQKIQHELQEMTDLPIWWSEYYGPGTYGQQDVAAAYAGKYHYMIKGGASAALLWNPMQGERAAKHYLFSTPLPGGAQPTPHYFVFKDIHDHFSKGTPIMTTFTSDDEVLVLASPGKAMLINMKKEPVTLVVNDDPYTLDPVEVKLVEAPVSLPAPFWRSTPVAPQDSSFRFVLEVTPLANQIGAIVGLSPVGNQSPTLGPAVRFDENGEIQVKNGGNWYATGEMYSQGVSYGFRMEVDLLSDTYDVYMTKPSGEVPLANGMSIPVSVQEVSFLSQFTGTKFLTINAVNIIEKEPGQLLPIDVVATSHASSNTADKTIDGDMNTRWSVSRIGESVVYDLGETTWLSAMEIAFYRGTERRTFFDLAVSADSTHWTVVYPGGESSGQSDDFERFEFPAIQGQYLKLIAKGNSANSTWASIYEVKIFESELTGQVSGLAVQADCDYDSQNDVQWILVNPNAHYLEASWFTVRGGDEGTLWLAPDTTLLVTSKPYTSEMLVARWQDFEGATSGVMATYNPGFCNLSQLSQANPARIFPVPAQDKIFLVLPAGGEAYQVKVYDEQGTVSWQGEVTQNNGNITSINVQGWKEGTHYMQITGPGLDLVKRVIKQ